MFLVLHKHETNSKAECNKTWKQGMANTKASQIDNYSTSAKNDACFFFHHKACNRQTINGNNNTGAFVL